MKRDISELKVYHGRVLSTRQVTPLMQRITLGDLDLPAFQSDGPDQFVYVFFPKAADRTTPPVPHSFTWEQARTMTPEERPVGRYYTIREHRPDAAEVDIDMVLHGEGPGATFAREATPGDAVSFWGPRIAFEPPAGAGFLVLLADLTGLPATASILASLPAGTRGLALIEVPDASEEQPLPTRSDIVVRWLHRGDTPAGKSDVLIDALREADLPAGDVYVYGAGEYRAMRQARRHLLEERGLPHDALSLINYWRHQDHPLEQEG